MLAFISAEIHKAAHPFAKRDATEAEKATARETLARRYDFIAKNMRGPYLFGPDFTVADAYLFVTLRWAKMAEVPLPAAISDFFDRVMQREAVRTALGEKD